MEFIIMWGIFLMSDSETKELFSIKQQITILIGIVSFCVVLAFSVRGLFEWSVFSVWENMEDIEKITNMLFVICVMINSIPF